MCNFLKHKDDILMFGHPMFRSDIQSVIRKFVFIKLRRNQYCQCKKNHKHQGAFSCNN